jgi:hypothetical protein
LQEKRGQRQQVLLTLAQRGQANREHVEPVIEISPESPGGHFGLQVAVGGGNDAHVAGNGSFAPYPFNLFFLQHP